MRPDAFKWSDSFSRMTANFSRSEGDIVAGHQHNHRLRD